MELNQRDKLGYLMHLEILYYDILNNENITNPDYPPKADLEKQIEKLKTELKLKPKE